jgi:hypothetical protein
MDSTQEEYFNLFGRRKQARSEGLSGKELRERTKELRKEDKGKSFSEKRDEAKERKENYNEALAEGTASKGFLGKAGQAVKKVGLAPVRGAFLVLVKLNVFALASKLALIEEKKESNAQVKKAYYRIAALWIKNGGKKNEIFRVAQSAKSKKPIAGKVPKSKGFDGTYSVTGVEEAAAATATATPILVPILGAITAVAGVIGGLATSGEGDQQFLQDEAANIQTTMTDSEAQKIVKDDDEEQKKKNKKTMIVLGVGLAAAVGLYFVFKSKKKK